jgi:selenophosphate synthetase-related protein
VVITCDDKKVEHIKQVAVKWGIQAERIGHTAPENLVIRIDGQRCIVGSVFDLKRQFERSLSGALHAEAPEHLVPEILQKS